MISNKRIALVIQGPMVSSGNSGAGTQAQSFDCNANVERLICESRKLVDGYVLSTWEGQAVTVRDERLNTYHFRDPGPQQTYFSDGPNNELRQAYGCLEGVKRAIVDFAPDYVLRVRTDQFMDIPAMLEHMARVDGIHDEYRSIGQAGFLYFPNMLGWSPYSVGDFFIGGHAPDLLAFFEAQVRYTKHSFVSVKPWVHSDLMLRHAYANLRGKVDLPANYFFPNLASAFRLDQHAPPDGFRYHPDVLRLWGELLHKSVCLFPRKVTESLEWRGERFKTERHSAGEFYEEWIEARTDIGAWMRRMQPALYSRNTTPGRLEILLNFCSEKRAEVEAGRPLFRRHLYRWARTALALATGRMPRDEWSLRLWQRWQRIVQRRRRR